MLTLLLVGCGRKPDSKPVAPAKVDKPIKEIDINNLTLTPEAEGRLGLKTGPVEKRKVQRTRSLGGEAVVPPGLGVTVSAPMSGTLGVAVATAPSPGASVHRGQALFALSLTSSDRMKLAESHTNVATARTELDAAIAKARIDLDAANIALRRAETATHEEVGSNKQLDEAKATQSLARAALKAAESRRDALLRTTAVDTANAPIAIASPMDGVLLRLHALPGQVVAAGAPLFEVARYDPIWIKVPVYVGDLGVVDAAKDALVGALSGSDTALLVARPVPAPPSANSSAATVDLFYELPNPGGVLRPGQLVNATIPLRAEEESLVLPWSAVVHDIYGGFWVYESTGAHTYARRRVQVRYVAGGVAALATGPKPGVNVVTEGAAELFGAEFGMGK